MAHSERWIAKKHLESLNYGKERFHTFRMYETMAAAFMKKVEASPDFRQIVLELAEEAAERNVI